MDKLKKCEENGQSRSINTNFDEIFYQSPIGILLYDKKGRLTNANNSALEIARIPKLEDVLDTNIFDNPSLDSRKEELHEKGLIKFQDSLDLIKIKKQHIYNPIQLKTIDIDWTVSITDSGYLIQIQDITKQKIVKDSLKDSESTLRSFFDATGDMRGIVEVVAEDDIRHITDNVITAGS
jgi:transcriptional regulator with PAS, ATPase and Fis domain